MEGAFGLRAVLDAEAEHYDFAFAALEGDGGGFALEAFGAMGVAGDQNVFGVVGIPRDDGTLDVGRGHGGLEGDGRINEGVDFVGQARANRMIGIDVDAQERAGDVEV